MSFSHAIISPPSILAVLSDDVLILILQYLCGNVRDIANFAQLCHYCNTLVEEFGWTAWLRENPRKSSSVSKAQSRWPARSRVRYMALSDRTFARAEPISTPLSSVWRGNFQPVMAVTTSRVIIGAGHTLFSYAFSPHAPVDHAPSVRFEGSHSFNKDITSVISIPDMGLDQTIVCGFADGSLETLRVESKKGSSFSIERIHDSMHQVHVGDLIESLCVSTESLLTLSSDGYVSLLSLNIPSPQPVCIDLHRRSWTAHLSTSYAAFGTSSTTPLSVHSVTPTHISPSPYLHLVAHSQQADRTAVYAIERAPPSSSLGSSDQVVTTGWFDGVVRVYDLRCSSRTRTNATTSLTPCLELNDPWSAEPIYSLSTGGGGDSHIAAGTARHSVISFWDVRSPRCGWSVHAPGNDVSPVYCVKMEGTRVFGATQSRPFVYDFGSGITETTYPRLRLSAANDSLRRAKAGGFYVTKYAHHRSNGLVLDS